MEAYNKAIKELLTGIKAFETSIAANQKMRTLAEQQINQSEANKVLAAEAREQAIDKAQTDYKTEIERADGAISISQNAIVKHDKNIERIEHEIQEMLAEIKNLEEKRDN